MKISNETKVGSITAIAITVLILGFNFLKGKTFFAKSHNLYAKYKNVQGLSNSNPVMINGLQVGTVFSITTDQNMKQILVNMNISKDVNIPTNSIALINSTLLGVTSIEIKLGDATTYIPKNDTIQTAAKAGMFSEVLGKVDPVLFVVHKAVESIDSVLRNINKILDPSARNNIMAILDNIKSVTAGLVISGASLQSLLNTQTGALAKALNNINSITTNLAASNEKITGILTNLDKTATNLSKLDIEKTLNILNSTVSDLKTIIGKFNTSTGTIGLLLNDPKLYNNLTATTNKLNLLIDDLKANPKRYVSLSIFGKKNTGTGLTVPLPDSVNAPYYKKN